MAVNRDKPDRWEGDIQLSVSQYNEWFLDFAPEVYRRQRIHVTGKVEVAMAVTSNLAVITPAVLERNPEILPILRMATSPPLARDRLVGLSGAPPQLIRAMDKDSRVPPRMAHRTAQAGLGRIAATLDRLLDLDIVAWKNRGDGPSQAEMLRAATVIADRLCAAVSEPIVRNAQERRQLAAIGEWLRARGYSQIEPAAISLPTDLPPGRYAFRLNVPARQGKGTVNIPIDAAVQPREAAPGSLPILIEAKSAGDFTNVNKRRKEEATKASQLRETYGTGVTFALFLCGYFGISYLRYEAGERIDWVWEHRVDDLLRLA